MIAKQWLQLGLLVMAVQAGFLTLPVMATDETDVSELIDAVESERGPDTAICSYNEQILLAEGPFEQITVCEFLYLADWSEEIRQLFLTELALPVPVLETETTRAAVRTEKPARPRSSSYSGGVEQWRSLVAKYFAAGDVDHALSVIDCESKGGDPNTQHPRSHASGLFQHLPKYWAERSAAAGFSGADIFNPEANVAVAAWLAYSEGWYHWPNCG